jgi:CRISPR-associated protein Cmr1
VQIVGRHCILTLVTPVITGGINFSVPEVRWQAIRGNIRRWHRVIDPGAVNEARIFGSPAKNRKSQPSGQGVWLMRPQSPTMMHSKPDANRLDPKYFTWAARNRSYLDPGVPANPTRVSFDIVFKPGTAEADKTRVLDALWLWSVMGGLGARTRRGFGSISLSVMPLQERTAATRAAASPRVTEWTQSLRARLGALSRSYDVRFSARIVVGPPSSSWSNALGAAATAMSNYRGDLPQVAASGVTAPATTRFGLPVSVAHRTFTGDGVNRSASPIWVRVVRTEDGYRPYVVWWPTPLLPPGALVRTPGIESMQVPTDEVLTDFLSALTKQGWQEVDFAREQ